MMYNNQFVVAVKSRNNGMILRESGETVYIPFGSEFSILLKNLSNRRADVKVSIDGEDVLNGSSLVVNGNESIDLERFLSDKNKGNRFKFVERTSSVENHRGVKAEDGLIRVEFAYEKQYLRQDPPYWKNGGYNPNSPWGNDSFDKFYGLNNRTYCSTGSPLRSTLNAVGTSGCNASVETFTTASVNEVGITVPGSISDQKFTTVSGFATDPSNVIVLRMVGEVGQNLVKEAVTVKTKPKCVTCGKLNKATNKFCSSCGTSLQII